MSDSKSEWPKKSKTKIVRKNAYMRLSEAKGSCIFNQ